MCPLPVPCSILLVQAGLKKEKRKIRTCARNNDEMLGNAQAWSESIHVWRVQNIHEKKRKPVRSGIEPSFLLIWNQRRAQMIEIIMIWIICDHERISCRRCLNVRVARTNVCWKKFVGNFSPCLMSSAALLCSSVIGSDLNDSPSACFSFSA